jgi:hypothetical protein
MILFISRSEVTHADINEIKLDNVGVGIKDDGLVTILKLACGFISNSGQSKLDSNTKKMLDN